MTKGQLGIIVLNSLLDRLKCYAEEKKISKTDVVVGALAKYSDIPENVSLGETITAVETRLAQVLKIN